MWCGIEISLKTPLYFSWFGLGSIWFISYEQGTDY
jgi:hypothetical protein